MHGRPAPLTRAEISRIVRRVLAAEKRTATVSLTFCGPARMRRLNLGWKGRDAITDVIAFALPQPGGGLAGDVYICSSRARAEARARGLTWRNELIRLVIHGTLHVLGYDHPEGTGRTRSSMWRRQERYVKVLA